MNEGKLSLVTGAPGWLGTNLVKALSKGLPDVESLKKPISRKIRCLVQNEDSSEILTKINPDIQICIGDIRLPSSLQEFFKEAKGATLFHIAGIVHPTHGVRELFDVNVRGTWNIIEAAELARIKRIIAVSSNSPMGYNANPDEVFDESSPYNPYMSYGLSKKKMEDAFNEVHHRGNIEIVILRIPWFYGPNQPPRQSLFFKMIRDGKAPILGDGKNKRSMAYVDNSCQGMLLSEITEEANSKTYWIADERPYPMLEIIETIENLLEKEFKIPCSHKRMKIPSFVGDAAECIDGIVQKVGFYNQKIHVLSEMNKTIACSVDKAKKELGYDPKISLEEGMRRSLADLFSGSSEPSKILDNAH
ncbi:NAD(P)-dependent oxidoreductase [bacterium]|nr:NAD(P)-dependent oxidoreductase [bacterium]